MIVAILLLTALPYSPFLSRASSIEKNPLAEIDRDGDGIPDPPFMDSDGDGLSDEYELSMGLITKILIWMGMDYLIWLKWISGTIW